MDLLDLIRKDWKKRSDGFRRTEKVLLKSLDDFNDVIDEFTETGDVELSRINGAMTLRQLICAEGSYSKYNLV